MYRAVLLLLVASISWGQATPLSRLKLAIEHAKANQQKAEAKFAEAGSEISVLQQALRDWIESRLPGDKATLSISLSNLESKMNGELHQAGIDEDSAGPGDDDSNGFGIGYVEFQLQLLPELPNTLLVTAGVSIPCGVDEAVYLYQFDSTSRSRVIEDHPGNSFGYGSGPVQLSQPDPQGRRLLLTRHHSVQCVAGWQDLAYSVYRLPFLPGVPEKLVSESHGIYVDDDGPEVELKPQSLQVKFSGNSVDSDVLIRPYVYSYDFTDGVRRVDPVAFQPYDFVDEWLTRPWSEMQSRSLPQTQTSHVRLHADCVLGEYQSVVPCLKRWGRWLIALDITNIGEKELTEPIRTYFLVRELSKYHYQMESVSEEKPEGCPGKGIDLNQHPWLPIAEPGTIQ